MRRIAGPASLDRVRRCSAIPVALITVAAPAQANWIAPFAWQLRGPFGVGARAGFSLDPCSLDRRFDAYSSPSLLLGFFNCWQSIGDEVEGVKDECILMILRGD